MRVVVGNVEHDVKIAACMSVPRLGFMDNYFCGVSAFSHFGIPITKGTGAFWDQVMSRILTEQSAEESGNTFLITVDYDSVFEPDCVSRLVSVAMVSGYDAVAPLQTKRDDQKLMFTPKGMFGKTEEIQLPVEWWEQPTQPADTAHFGLTVIRCSALRRMPKPWFLGVTGENGDWGDGRTDPDIFFWHRFKECGNTLAVCPQVSIGHAELVITWPDQRLKAIHQYPNHYWTSGGRRPPEAWGSPEHAVRSTEGAAK
jgi:hypothetical protein